MARKSQAISADGFDLERFFDFAVDMLCIADASGYFRKVNRSFERVLGYTSEELLAKPFVEFVHPDDRADTVAETARLSSGQLTLAFENRYRCKDGSWKHISWTSYPDPESGLLYAVARDVTEQRQRENRLDGITGVTNHDAWTQVLDGEWRRAVRLKIPLAVALLDVDHLRAYNEQHGHLEGDRRLREIAGTLDRRLRRTGDLVGRYRGGTFGVLFGGAPDARQATAHADKLRAAVEALDHAFDGPGGKLALTMSGGVVSRVPRRDGSLDALIAAASATLAKAKVAGRNRVLSADG